MIAAEISHLDNRYTKADVLRWQQVDEGRLQMKLAQLTDTAFAGRRDFVLSGLHLLHEGLGYTYVALNEPERARSHFLDSCHYVVRLFELPEIGEAVAPSRLSAGYCPTWLIAMAIGAEDIAKSLTALFKSEYLTHDMRQAGMEQIAVTLKALVEGRVGDAQVLLSQSPISNPGDFQHYLECLAAIAEGSDDGFRASLELAARSWAERIVRTHKGLPQAVCFMHGLGLLRLAERVFGRSLEIDIKSIPSRLF